MCEALKYQFWGWRSEKLYFESPHKVWRHVSSFTFNMQKEILEALCVMYISDVQIMTEHCKGWIWEQLYFSSGTPWWNWCQVSGYRCFGRCEEGTKWTCHSSNEETRAVFSWKLVAGIDFLPYMHFDKGWWYAFSICDFVNSFLSLAKEYYFLGLLELGKPSLPRLLQQKLGQTLSA